MDVLKVLFIVFLMICFIFLIVLITRAKLSKCQQFGSDVFEGTDGNCYSCPSGLTVRKDKTGTIVPNSLGVPICIANSTKPMTETRKTVNAANLVPNSYVGAQVVDTSLANAILHGSFTQPVASDSSCPADWQAVTNPTSGLVTCHTSCPAGTSPDTNSGLCYSCPDGYTRTSADVNSSSACKKSCPAGSLEGPYSKDSLSVSNPSSSATFGKCYKCPTGYIRSTYPIDSDKACTIVCPANSFTIHDECYECSAGYTQNTSATSAREACYKPCSADGANIFEDRSNQSCYECPAGYTKDPNQNVSPFNSLSCINNQQQAANLISAMGADGRMVSPDVIQKKLNTFNEVVANP